MPDTIESYRSDDQPYGRRSKRQSFQTMLVIGGIIGFIIVVFGVLFGAGRFIAGS